MSSKCPHLVRRCLCQGPGRVLSRPFYRRAVLASFCDKIWPLVPHPKPRKRGCPDRVVTMSTPIIYVSRQRILTVPYANWVKLLEVLDDGDDKLLLFSFHMLFAQPAVLQQRLMRLH